ncbi:hypothetical protein J4226_04185 [Candidatus Pacearchaeota archaeon]|nr:hypothetical protein [Candidatus Pacearchaeota archaeon]
MKREIIILLLITLILPIATADQDVNPKDLLATPPNLQTIKTPDSAKPNLNVWNETVIISPTWQTLIGTFFGLNLKNVSTEISVREALVLFLIFIMFFMIISDILSLTPFFKTNFGPISAEFLAALIITILVSISGSFINLKNIFINAIFYTITALDWDWLNYLTQNKVPGIIITIFIIIPILFVIHEIFDFLEPIIKKHSQVSKAESKGRLLNSAIEKSGI